MTQYSQLDSIMQQYTKELNQGTHKLGSTDSKPDDDSEPILTDIKGDDHDNNINNQKTEELPTNTSEDDYSPQDYHSGSFANCTVPSTHAKDIPATTSDDAGSITVSCKTIFYRVPVARIISPLGIITGILSSASGEGPSRRKIIRETWANNRTGIFFLVAGPWNDVQEEYNEKQDLIWIDEEEVYNGEESVLTLKTYSFFAIARAAMKVHGDSQEFQYTHLFKTDDDSYVNIDALYTELHASDDGVDIYKGRKGSSHAGTHHDYVGQCQLLKHEVHRESEYKWPVRKETYPERWFPRYCQGAGFAISKKFVDCAVDQGSVANVRFMPFEDVAVGMLAERCDIDPQWPSTASMKVFRYQSDEVKIRTRTGDKRKDDLVAPAACMTDKILQHRIIDDFDMEQHHKTVLDPSYCDVTKANRESVIKVKNEEGIEWFG